MFLPRYLITSRLVKLLMRIEFLRKEIIDLPLTVSVLASLRETAKIDSIHYSTKIEGNRLTTQEVERVLYLQERIEGKERDEKEVLGYYASLEFMIRLVKEKVPLSESSMQKLHALIMGGGKKNCKPMPYRDGQNVIKDCSTRKIVYLPPEAHDVPALMHDLVDWIQQAEQEEVPIPLIAGITHCQYVTIHPYYDGNGRMARLLASYCMQRGGYDLKGLYSLEEYYAKNLSAYYETLAIGPHNYYFGRAEADISAWLDYFCQGIVDSFERVRTQAVKAYEEGKRDFSAEFNKIDPLKRLMIDYFHEHPFVTCNDIAKLLNLKPRTARALCLRWVREGFLLVRESSKKKRSYRMVSSF